MFEVGRTTNTSTPEFSIYKLNSVYTKNGGFLVELDGEALHMTRTVEEAHKFIKAKCREDHIKGAGVCEVFGRNRRFLTTPRYGFKLYKGD